MARRFQFGLPVALLVCATAAVAPARAEEFTLESGQKIVGTVVGYENGMFKVETEFGYALVRKDRIRSITFSTGPSKEATPKRAAEKEPPKAAKPATPAPEGSGPLNPTPVQPPPESALAKPTPPAAPPKPPPPPASRPVDTPLPAKIEEHLDGTTYINDTFQFAMYKPPGWKIHEGVSRETGRAIVAIGTEDERTVLFVERQVWSGAPDLKRDAVEVNLRRTYEDYRVLGQSSLQLDGRPALRRDFTGVLEGTEWHGVSVRLAQGNTAFGIIGLTSSDMFEFQQAVLDKIIRSFHFLSVPPATAH
ncbi:MAG: hypothetical protein LAN62_13030 [Acidobacteriia bacterium]|nr:hypothetical protein [Terriglobia bacterium]